MTQTHEEMVASGQHECAADCPPLTNPVERSEPKTEPRTAAGRALLEHMTEDANGFVAVTSGRFHIKWVLDALAIEIPKIEAEAAEQSVPLDVEALAKVLERLELDCDPQVNITHSTCDHDQQADQFAAEYARLSPDDLEDYMAEEHRRTALASDPRMLMEDAAAYARLVDGSRKAFDGAQASQGVASGEADTALREAAGLLADSVRRYFNDNEAKAVVNMQPLVEKIDRLLAAQPIQASPTVKPTSAEDSE